MSEESVVEFVEDWQTGFFILLGIGLVGIVVGAIVGAVTGEIGMYLGALGGMVLGFLAVAYLFY